MTFSSPLQRLRAELGDMGLLSLALLAGAAAFLFLTLKPLETRDEMLGQRLERSERRGPSDPGFARGADPAEKLTAFYRFFETEEATTDWLAKLYAIGKSVGVELRAADYKLQKGESRIQRYQITLPVTGSYAQIRAFLENALIQVPVLSLDQVKFHKERANDASVRADVQLTLHLIKP